MIPLGVVKLLGVVAAYFGACWLAAKGLTRLRDHLRRRRVEKMCTKLIDRWMKDEKNARRVADLFRKDP